MENEMLAFGGELKALGDGKIAGYLLMYGDQDNSDLEGEYFTPETEFDISEGHKIPVYYQHGLDGTLKSRRLGKGTLKFTSAGIWLEAQLALRDAWEKAVYELVAQGKMGLSSGAVRHLVERQAKGRAVWIKKWVMGEASITPTPAEPRTTLMAVKNYRQWLAETDCGEASKNGKSLQEADASGESAPAELNLAQENQQGENMQEKQDITESTIKGLIDEAIRDLPRLSGEWSTGTSEEKTEVPAVKAFQQYLRTGVKATMVEGTEGQGGYLVPETMAGAVATPLSEASVVRHAGARVLTVTGTDTFKIPVLSHSNAAVLTGEGSSYDQQEPTLNQVAMNPYKYTRLSKVSEELIADAGFDVYTQVLAPDALQAFALAENAAFTTGTGSSQPEGIVTGATTGVTTTSASAITADEVIELFHALGYLYRQNAVWMMHDSTLEAVRKLKDDDNHYLWQPSLQAGQPETLLGRPVYTNNFMDEIGTGNSVMVFGDFSYFVIADFGQLSMQRLNELYAEDGLVGFRWFKRFDSKVVLAEAIQTMEMA